MGRHGTSSPYDYDDPPAGRGGGEGRDYGGYGRDHGSYDDRDYVRDSSYSRGRRSRHGDHDDEGGRYRDDRYDRRHRDDGYGAYDGHDPYDRDDRPAPAARAAVGAASVASVKAERDAAVQAHYEKHGGTRRAGGPGRRRAGGPKPEDVDDPDEKKKLLKKRKRKRRLIALACVTLMVMGVGLFAGTIFFEEVPLPGDIPMPESSTVLYANGKDMARLGSAYRVKVDINTLPDHVKWAVIAAEDQSFYDNPGVDFKGVLRAFWNNITGGDTQGASTITQQYAGLAADFRDEATYGRKAQEAVMAMKLDDEYTKDEILGFYLDLVPFGRTAQGIGAAAQAFFGKDAKDLKINEAALLAAQIKSPNGAYDPQDPMGIDNAEAVQQRLDYVLNSMVKVGAITEEQRAENAEVPETLEKTSNPASVGLGKPTGFVSHDRVLDELAKNYGITEEDLLNKGGYTITTTLDKKMQQAAEDAASKNGDILKDMPDNLRSALVAVDPRTGEVKAYYGGSDDGSDVNKASMDSPHQPGSSFKVFTMLTALQGTDKHGAASIESLWDGTSPQEFEDRATPVTNSENDNSCGKDCKLIDAIRKSLNTPVYSMTRTFGAANIVATARDMGITQMVGGDGEYCDHMTVDLTTTPKEDFHNCFDNEVGFGQYMVSVEDMAAAFATLANQGSRVPAHFIKKVEKDGEEIAPNVDLSANQAISKDAAIDAAHVMSVIHPSASGRQGTLNDGSQFAGKTGTWERVCKDACNQNAQNWYVGFVPELSTAVWLGDKQKENGSIEDSNGNALYGSQVSGDIWLDFMNEAIKHIKDREPTVFPPPTMTGSPTNGDHAAPVTAPDPPDDPDPTDEPEDPEPSGTTDPTTGPTPTEPTDPGETTDPGGGDNCPIWNPNC